MRIGIIGTGLIGGSLGLALKGNKKYSVYCFNRRVEISKKAVQLGAAQKYFETIEELTKNSDVIIIATPLASYPAICKKISKELTAEKIISDIGSVKYLPVKEALKNIPKIFHNNFIPAHPIAGSEKAGVENAKAEMFADKKLLITPYSKTTSAAGIKIISQLWKTAGSKVEMLDAKKHDEIYAHVSHYVQFLSFELSKIIKTNLGEFNRLMNSPREMWNEIFEFNHVNLDKINRKFIRELAKTHSPIKTTRAQNSDLITAIIAAQILDDITPTAYKRYAGSGYKSFTSVLKNSK